MKKEAKMEKYNADDWICFDCIGDKLMREKVKSEGKKHKCINCENKRSSFKLSEIASEVDKVFKKYYEKIEPRKHDYLFPRRGRDPIKIINEEILRTNDKLSHSIVKYFEEKEKEKIKTGGNIFYDTQNNYKRKNSIFGKPTSNTYTHMWEKFENKIKYEKRYFYDEINEILNKIFKNITDIKDDKNPKPCKIINTNDHFYRARTINDVNDYKKIEKDIPESILPPPNDINKGGRMNPPGISYFYGGLSEEVCVTEMKQNIGGLVVMGEFKTTKKLKLLDFTKIENHYPDISMFRKDFENVENQWRFLNSFHNIITKPIMPYEKEIEYIPTQVVAEYISEKLNYDGIVYSSSLMSENSKDKEKFKNIVIFPKIKQKQKKETSKQKEIKQNIMIDFTEQDNFKMKNGFDFINYIKDSFKVFKINSIKYEYTYEGDNYLKRLVNDNEKI